MGFLSNATHNPRRLWLRRALFQIHLWAGVLLSLYLVVMALSGSVLVFKDELMRGSLPASLHQVANGGEVPPGTIVDNFRAAEPGATIDNLQVPTAVLPVYLLIGKNAKGQARRWIADPVTGQTTAAPSEWLETLQDLHNNLLLPAGWGMQVNGLGGALLLLVAVTGLVLWWPGVRLWTRGLRLNLRSNWRRVNYDLHSAIGFWTLAIVAWWALSGFYFGWYRQVTAVVAAISPLQGMLPPAPASAGPVAADVRPSLEAVLQAAQKASPGGHLWSVSDPLLRTGECYVLLDRGQAGNFAHRDIVRVRSADARVLSVWHYGQRHSLGDWMLWSMHPLHFGTVWGLAVKVLWFLLGMSLAVLTITGLLMYWNRFLRHRWRRLSGVAR